jgi:glycosyltransferase involved in cell wall biosynthesis
VHYHSLYAAFDQFPSKKGAAHHIQRFAPVLFETCSPGLLYVIGGEDLPAYQEEGNATIIRFSEDVQNFLERSVFFGRQLYSVIEPYRKHLRIAHFRDPFSGMPIIDASECSYKTIYEINGLPSIELPSAYPSMSQHTIDKISHIEKICMEKCDHIITVSRTLETYLLANGIAEEKITVLPNGAECQPAGEKPDDAPERYLIYFGALQSWQGVDILLKAFRLLADLDDLHLVICSSVKERTAKPYKKLSEKLGVADKVLWKFRLSEQPLRGWLSHAEMSIAPLRETDRNLTQGCSPLKILESMAAGVAVVASDLPCVREIMADGEHGFLVRPDRPQDLARSIRVLIEYPDQRRAMGKKGKEHIRKSFTWKKTTGRLEKLYRTLLDNADPITDNVN